MNLISRIRQSSRELLLFAAAALTAAVTIDHVFSITAALLGGVIWNVFGFQYVFLLGMLIAIINFFVALRVRLPQTAMSRIGQR